VEWRIYQALTGKLASFTRLTKIICLTGRGSRDDHQLYSVDQAQRQTSHLPNDLFFTIFTQYLGVLAALMPNSAAAPAVLL